MNGKEVKIGACLLVGDVSKMVGFYRDILGFHTEWDGGNFAEFDTASGPLSLFMYSREAFAEAIREQYLPPKGNINQTCEIALWLPDYTAVDKEYARLCAIPSIVFPTGAPVTYPF